MNRSPLRHIPAPADQNPLLARAFKATSTVRLEGALEVASTPKISKSDLERSFGIAGNLALDTETAQVWQSFFTRCIEVSRLRLAALGLRSLSGVSNLTPAFFVAEFSRVLDEYHSEIARSGKPPRGASIVPTMLQGLAAVHWSPLVHQAWLSAVRGPEEIAGGDPRAIRYALEAPHIPKSKLVEIARAALERFTVGAPRHAVRSAVFSGIRRGVFGDRCAEILEHAAVAPSDITELLWRKGESDPNAVREIFERRLAMFEGARFGSFAPWIDFRAVMTVLTQMEVPKGLSKTLQKTFPEIPAASVLRVAQALHGRQIAHTPLEFIRQLKEHRCDGVTAADATAFALTVLKLSSAEDIRSYGSLVHEVAAGMSSAG